MLPMRRKVFPPAPIGRAEHLALLKRAIAANLRARAEHDDRCARKPNAELACAADLQAADRDWLHLSAVIRDPTREALRAQLRGLGERLFALVGVDGMEEVADEIAGADAFGWRTDTLVKNWDGIGRGRDRWRA